jgi:hypothetical protein
MAKRTGFGEGTAPWVKPSGVGAAFAPLVVSVLLGQSIDAQGFAPQETISTLADIPYSVFAEDVDGDGDLDVLSASRDDNKIAWYENTDGLGTFGAQRVISTTAYRARSVFAVDLDGDLDIDVLSASAFDDKIAWYENTDGLGTFGPEQVITTLADFAKAVFTADLDGDGDQDVLSASQDDDKIAWYENTDGLGTFGPQQVISITADFVQSVFAIDLDGDGDIDVLSASMRDDKVAWYENTDGLGTFGVEQVISSAIPGAHCVRGVDLDGDLDHDIVAAAYDAGSVFWFENTDGQGTFGAPQLISDQTLEVRSIHTADLDLDGDQDVLSASVLDDKIAWYENTDGLGTFGAQQVISTDADMPLWVFTADLDGDLDEDVLSASFQDDKVAWYENSPAATVTFRNPGSNPASLAALTMPVLGATYTCTVDLAGTTGHSTAMLVGYPAALTFSLPYGQMGLVDVTRGEVFGFPIDVGPTATFDISIPPDMSYTGFRVYTQAGHFGTISPFALSNALDLLLGF